MLKILIGPNGFGKTTDLHKKKQGLIDSGIEESKILFLESEILVLEEVKDTTDKTFTMDYIITEILENDDINTKRNKYEDSIDKAIASSVNNFNEMLDDVILLNSQTREKDVIGCSKTKEHKKLVKINADEIKGKLGSGQRMQFILSLVKKSKKEYIFIDEPEKHSHPSLLNLTAKLIRELSKTKNVYIATHSPKLLEMLDFNYLDIEVFNDPTFTGSKTIDLVHLPSTIPAGITLSDLKLKSQTYFNNTQLEKNINEIHKKDFLEALFCKKVYIIEGVNDELFLKRMLIQYNKQYEDYYIFRAFGKQHMLPFIKIFQDLVIDVVVFFDEDNLSNVTNTTINLALEQFTYHKFVPDIETELGYTGHKLNTVDFLSFLDTYTIPNTYNL